MGGKEDCGSATVSGMCSKPASSSKIVLFMIYIYDLAPLISSFVTGCWNPDPVDYVILIDF